MHIELPYGNAEGVGVSTSQIPDAGRGLFGLRPLQDAPHLFAKQGQFICTYATQRHQISALAASTSSSRYLWSTNTGHRRNSRALYFDASAANHYGKFINDKWNKHANNCEFRWNPATGRVEVYALRDIHLNEELGSDYDAPFWYQRHNGLTSLAQAQQVQSYYQQRKLPWYSTKPPHTGLPNQAASTPTPPVHLGAPTSQSAPSEPLTTPPTDSTTPSPTSSSPQSQDGKLNLPPAHLNYMDLTSSPTASPTTATPNPTVQPIRPSHLQLGTNSEVTQQLLDERRTIDRTYGLDCSIQSTRNISTDHRFHHPQLYRLCTGGLLTGDIIHAIMDIQNTMRPNVCFKHMDNYVRDPTHTNLPSARIIKDLFSAHLVGLLHNHNGLHWASP